ncbi:MAG: glutaredoxin family protein [Deltaproteobacteria bacterium]|nr:glutaredoxin family protein [Deltaproteobacteria bacterium]
MNLLFILAVLAGPQLAPKPALLQPHPVNAVPADNVSEARVTVYGATWCSACKSLEASLRSRGIPFEVVDVDENPAAFAIAKKAAGVSAVPLTNVIRGPAQTWIVGADPDGVERAYKGG